MNARSRQVARERLSCGGDARWRPRRNRPRGYFNGRVPRDGSGPGRCGRSTGNTECARSRRPLGVALTLPCLKTDVDALALRLRLCLDAEPVRSLPPAVARWLRPRESSARDWRGHPRFCTYLRETQRTALDHLERPAFYDRANALVLDATAVRNLELVEPLFAGRVQGIHAALPYSTGPAPGWVDACSDRRLLAPSIDVTEINTRLDAITELHAATILRADLAEDLGSILDLERLLAEGIAVLRRSTRPAGARSLARCRPDAEETPRPRQEQPDSRTCSPASTKSRTSAIRILNTLTDEAQPSPSPTATSSAPASIPRSTNCATSRSTAKPTSRRSNSASGPAPASSR